MQQRLASPSESQKESLKEILAKKPEMKSALENLGAVRHSILDFSARSFAIGTLKLGVFRLEFELQVVVAMME